MSMYEEGNEIPQKRIQTDIQKQAPKNHKHQDRLMGTNDLQFEELDDQRYDEQTDRFEASGTGNTEYIEADAKNLGPTGNPSHIVEDDRKN